MNVSKKEDFSEQDIIQQILFHFWEWYKRIDKIQCHIFQQHVCFPGDVY